MHTIMVIMLAYAINFPHCHVTHLRWRSPVLMRHAVISFLHSFGFFCISFITTWKYKNQRKPKNPREKLKNPREKQRNRRRQKNRREQKNRRKRRNPRGQMSPRKPKCRQSLLYGEQYDITAYAHLQRDAFFDL